MIPDIVVDIGNSRLKWGICVGGRVVEVLRLPLEDVRAWDAALANLPSPLASVRQWAVASVNPSALSRFIDWASIHGGTAYFETHTDFPIRVNTDEPAKVGLDRLCGAVAAKAMVSPGTPAITVDVGTAVTVNLIDAEGVFQGGAIMPGPRLMGRALHDHTAKLPLVDLGDVPALPVPGRNTVQAIEVGIAAAVQGGVTLLVERLAATNPSPWLFITGGGRGCLSRHAFQGMANIVEMPELNLEGIRIAAEVLP